MLSPFRQVRLLDRVLRYRNDSSVTHFAGDVVPDGPTGKAPDAAPLRGGFVTDYTTPPPPPPPPPPPGPPGGVPPYDPTGMGGYGTPPQKPQNAFGIAALVLGILSIICCCLYAGIW